MKELFFRISDVARNVEKLNHPYNKITIDRYVKHFAGQIGKLKRKKGNFYLLKFTDGTEINVPLVLCIPVFSKSTEASNADINTLYNSCNTSRIIAGMGSIPSYTVSGTIIPNSEFIPSFNNEENAGVEDGDGRL